MQRAHGNDTVFGGANDTISLGNGQNQLVAAPGDVWTVGSGQDTFAFNAGFGNNTITDFNTSRDVLQFNHALFVNFAAAMADTKQVGANTVITYDANDSVTLTGVAASHLTARSSSSRNRRGVPTASDGGHVAMTALLGRYLPASVVRASDSQGRTLISDPPQTAHPLLSLPHG